MFEVISISPSGHCIINRYATLLAAWRDATERKTQGHREVTIHRPANPPIATCQPMEMAP